MKLRDRLTTDYSLAIVGGPDDTCETLLGRFNRGDGVPVLAIAEGPIGVLRAMRTRCEPVHPVGPFTLALVKLVGETMVLHWCQLIGRDGAE